MTDIKVTQWFALKTIFSREQIVEKHLVKFCREQTIEKHLAEQNVQCFIPMKYKVIVKDERKQRILVPAIHNIVFVNSTRALLDDYIARKGGIYSVQYMRDLVTNEPIIIPQQQMTNFMLVTGTHSDDLIYLNDPFEKFSQHEKVQVSGGLLEGMEGHVVRIRRDRKVVVSIYGVVAVAVSGIHPPLLKRINQ